MLKKGEEEQIGVKSDQIGGNETENNHVVKVFLLAKFSNPNASSRDRDFARNQLKGFGVQL